MNEKFTDPKFGKLGFQMSRHCHLQTKFGSTRLNPVQNFEFILS